MKRLLIPGKDSLSGVNSAQHEWSIGIYVGDSPFSLGSPEHLNNPVLTSSDISDLKAAFVADPFMLIVDKVWYMFFEVMNRQTRKGEIGLARSDDGTSWIYQQIVLAEPYHLSYPYVFEWSGDYYMIPESYQAQAVRLYRASAFPTQWSLVATLLSGPYYADASIFRFTGKWWLFAETNPAMKHDTLRLYCANDLLGPWLEHARSPIIEGNGHIARPAGRVLVVGNQIIRFTQDCDPTYGTRVRAFTITALSPTSYQEQQCYENPVLSGSGEGWNESGMHHIDAHIMEDGRWVAAVDGWRSVPEPGS